MLTGVDARRASATGAGAGFEYTNPFTCIPTALPFRPPRSTRKPVVGGPQTAVVVGPAGEEIFTDKYGRVKVQFHWDREGKKDANSSCWIRVAPARRRQRPRVHLDPARSGRRWSSPSRRATPTGRSSSAASTTPPTRRGGRRRERDDATKRAGPRAARARRSRRARRRRGASARSREIARALRARGRRRSLGRAGRHRADARRPAHAPRRAARPAGRRAGRRAVRRRLSRCTGLVHTRRMRSVSSCTRSSSATARSSAPARAALSRASSQSSAERVVTRAHEARTSPGTTAASSAATARPSFASS